MKSLNSMPGYEPSNISVDEIRMYLGEVNYR